MSDDLIKRSDAIRVASKECHEFRGIFGRIEERIKELPSADRPSAVDLSSVYSTAYKSGYEKGKADGAMIYGNEHNCVMTIFGECSYAETGCGDCAVVEKVRKALSADRPQGEWIDKGRNLWGCSKCGMEIYSESERDRNEFHKWCSRCGARMKGADDE